MRILWHGIPPWHKTAYGLQTGLFVPRLRELGHEFVIAMMGVRGRDDNPAKAHPGALDTLRTGEWDGIPVIGPGMLEFGLPPVADIQAAFGGHDPDLVLVLKDPFVLAAGGYRRWNTAVWANIDCESAKGVGAEDRDFFVTSGARPIAVSEFGLQMMARSWLDRPLYVPHGIGSGLWSPGSKAASRRKAGLPEDVFIAGINAVNAGSVSRKGFPEQLEAFARFHANHPRSLLLAHTVPEHKEGISLRAVCDELGITDCVLFGATVSQPGENLLNWYRSLDVLLACSYGEGFCVPIVEALACGIPVIGTDCSAISEKIGPHCGWLVPGQKWWHPHFAAWWTIPNVDAITDRLERAFRWRGHVPPDAAAKWDADYITREYWKPALEELTP
jgi:glycosyltransferase involved in cell wall biosynthesis